MKNVLTALTLGVGLVVAGAPIARAHEGHSHAADAAPLTKGEVMKVDLSAANVTIKHGPIRNLDMDAMTMVFHAQDPGLLQQVKAGDKIRFAADTVNGQLTVIKLEKTK